MRRGQGLVVALVLVATACAGDGVTDGPATDGPTTPSPVAATESASHTTQSSITLVSTPGTAVPGSMATLPTIVVTPAGELPDGVCADPTPVSTMFGPPGTFLRVEGDEVFEGVIQAWPDVACPGDEIEFTVSVLNTADTRRFFRTTKGLLLYTGGPQKWPLAPIPEVGIGPGAVWSTTVTATIPAALPGTHGLSAGSNVHGSITVLDPATAHDP